MGVYSSLEVYPKEYDEIEYCDGCDFDCWSQGYCIKEKKEEKYDV